MTPSNIFLKIINPDTAKQYGAIAALAPTVKIAKFAAIQKKHTKQR
jgi:hypothetical protein